VGAVSDTHVSARKHQALALFAGLPRHYHAMGALLSFGQDPRWRRMLVAAIGPRPGERVLDVATGTGLVATALARSGCEVVAVDQSEPMLDVARARLARARELTQRVRFVTGEAERLPFEDGEFDALTFTYLLRYVDDRGATLRELARVVKPGGRIGMVEFGVPSQAPLRALWRVYTRRFMPLFAGVVRGWALSGAEHRGALRSRAGCERTLAGGRYRGRHRAEPEFRGRARDVGRAE
jgi:demethylmenaquinone methyltransferase/2-methoxy-6-polyprenyl-1,4-benzoquinol methylase